MFYPKMSEPCLEPPWVWLWMKHWHAPLLTRAFLLRREPALCALEQHFPECIETTVIQFLREPVANEMLCAVKMMWPCQVLCVWLSYSVQTSRVCTLDCQLQKDPRRIRVSTIPGNTLSLTSQTTCFHDRKSIFVPWMDLYSTVWYSSHQLLMWILAISQIYIKMMTHSVFTEL